MLVKGYSGYLGIWIDDIWIEKQGLAMRLGEGDGAAAALLKNQITFWSSHPSRRHFLAQFSQTSPARLFDEGLCMNIGIPRVFGVAVDSISVCLKLEIASGAYSRIGGALAFGDGLALTSQSPR